jgi:MoxR-like ATPase
MSKPEASEPPPAVILTANAIIDGKFIRAGDPLPYEREEDLPEAMKAFIASGNEAPPFNPAERDIYSMHPAARRAVRKLEMQAAHKEFAEQIASAPLPEDVQAALEDSHNITIGRAKAQAEYNAKLTDDVYKQLEEEAAAKVIQFFVRRGGEWGKVQNAKLKPGEHVFVRRENDQMEAVGVVNSNGGLPPQEIIP